MQLIADDAVMLEAGSVETRADYGKNHLPADIEFEKGVSTKRSPIRVVVRGDTAWATSTSEVTGTFEGNPSTSSAPSQWFSAVSLPVGVSGPSTGLHVTAGHSRDSRRSG